MLNNKIIFITGGTGTWGQAITKSILENYDVNKIIIFSRSEDKQVLMEEKFGDYKLKFILGDVRNIKLLEQITKNVDYIIHLAALKHIKKCEENKEEAESINIDGTKNIIEVSIKNNIKKVLYVSTDKAVEPYNLYGNTKSISEDLIINANNKKSNTTFYIIRAGNIIGSNGSVVRILYNQIINKKILTITDYKMNRFYISIEDMIDLIFFSFPIAKPGEIFIAKCDIFSLKNILDILLKLYGIGDERVIVLGKRKGEKENEILISKKEVNNTYIVNEKYFLIDKLLLNNNNYKKVEFSEYSTNSKGKFNFDKISNYINNLIK